MLGYSRHSSTTLREGYPPCCKNPSVGCFR